MSDDFDDKLLAGAFAEFRDEAVPYVKPAGTAAAHATVRGRKRAHAITVTTLAALFVVGPITAYATVDGDPHGPPPTAIGESGSPTPTPSASTSGPTVSGTPAGTGRTQTPDGRISTAELGRATLEIPPWAPDAIVEDCPSGKVRFSGGLHLVRDSVSLRIREVVYADVDRDGAQETVAWLACGDQGSTYQVVAFDRTADGEIRTIGQVAAQTGTVLGICDIRASAKSGVEVKVVDQPADHQCSAPLPAWAQEQWRGYTWNGDGFVQTAGPTGFPVNRKSSDLAVTATDLVFAAPVDGVRRGSMKVTVRNVGAAMVPYTVRLDLPGGLQLVESDACTSKAVPGGTVAVSCGGLGVRAGESRSFTLEFTTQGFVQISIIPMAYVEPDDGWGDPRSENNRTQFEIRF